MEQTDRKADSKLNKNINKLSKNVNTNLQTIVVAIVFVLFAVFLFNVFNTSSLYGKLSVKATELKEANRPAELQVTKILASDCSDCFNIENALSELKKQNVDITDEKALSSSSDEAKKLIEDYSIEKLPTLIIKGELDKSEQLTSFFNNIGKQTSDSAAVIYTAIEPPYKDLALDKIVGRVSITKIIDSSCAKCIPLDDVIDSLRQSRVAISDLKTIEYSSAQGKQLISKHDIKHIPALLISNEIDYYDAVSQALLMLELKEKDGFYALHSTLPPYRNLTTNKIDGLVDLIMLTDNSCTDCYNVELNKQVLARLGMVLNSEKTYDINSNEGKQLISKYSIQKAPMILVSPEANVYINFVVAWQQVGEKESDGWFVMRKPEALGKTKDI